jgi:flagella basal body P-ring formation protein FlgA
MLRRLVHPIVLVALATLFMLGARLAAAQGPRDTTAVSKTTYRVAVAARPIARGAVITDDDIMYVDSTAQLSAMTKGVAAGWVARRVINPGEPLRSPAVQQPVLVSANQPVQLEWTDGTVSLTMRGTATRSGSVGERITVRVDNRRIDGVVIAAGRIRIS